MNDRIVLNVSVYTEKREGLIVKYLKNLPHDYSSTESLRLLVLARKLGIASMP